MGIVCYPKLLQGNQVPNSTLLLWSILDITSTCRKYRAVEKVFIVVCRLSNTPPFNLSRLSF